MYIVGLFRQVFKNMSPYDFSDIIVILPSSSSVFTFSAP